MALWSLSASSVSWTWCQLLQEPLSKGLPDWNTGGTLWVTTWAAGLLCGTRPPSSMSVMGVQTLILFPLFIKSTTDSISLVFPLLRGAKELAAKTYYSLCEIIRIFAFRPVCIGKSEISPAANLSLFRVAFSRRFANSLVCTDLKGYRAMRLILCTDIVGGIICVI